MSEKDLFLILSKATNNLKRVIIADDPEVPGKSLGIAVVQYQSHEDCSSAQQIFSDNFTIMDKTVKSCWKDPNYDIITELSYETRVIEIWPLSYHTTVHDLKQIFDKFGTVLRIKKYATKCLVEFETIQSCKLAYESLNEKRVDGLVWNMTPARKFDTAKQNNLPDRNICFSKNF